MPLKYSFTEMKAISTNQINEHSRSSEKKKAGGLFLARSCFPPPELTTFLKEEHFQCQHILQFIMVVMASYLGVFEFLRLVSFVDICKKIK